MKIMGLKLKSILSVVALGFDIHDERRVTYSVLSSGPTPQKRQCEILPFPGVVLEEDD